MWERQSHKLVYFNKLSPVKQNLNGLNLNKNGSNKLSVLFPAIIY